jgi:hypothetical protein
MRRLLLPAVALLLAAGCASEPAGTPGAAIAADQVVVHESVASVTRPFKVIKRVWVDSWASNLYLPTYASREEAVRAFQQHAASAGGDGVINFGCYRWGDAAGASLGCNGTVVRFQ